MRFKAVIALLALATTTLTMPAQSGVCEEEFMQHAREGELGYHERMPNRCEGLFWEKEVAGQFAVVSFLFGVLDFDWRKDIVLDVVFPDAHRGLNQDSIHVVAVPRALGTYYRLDGRLPLRWPIGDVLYPERLNARKLGIYGMMEKGSIYVPLYVTQRDKEANKWPRDAATLGIRSNIPVENVSWQVSPRVNGNCSDYSQSTQVHNPRFAESSAEFQFDRGEVISFALPIELAKTLCIKLEGQEQVTGKVVRHILTVYLPLNKNE